MSEQRCENCRFWRREPTEESELTEGVYLKMFGECRRLPPVRCPQLDDGADLGFFPITPCGVWCGEWKSTEETAEKPIRLPNLVDKTEAAQLLGVTARGVQKCVDDGLASFLIVDQVRFDTEDIARYLALKKKAYQSE